MPAPDSFYQKPPDPRLRTGAGGVVARIDPSTNRILLGLIRDSDAPEFVLPKGGVEAGESLEQAAAREIAEEAGLTDLTCLTPLGTGQRLTGKKKAQQTTHYFLFLTRQSTGAPTDKRPWQLHWFDLDHLPPLYWREQARIVAENLAEIRTRILAHQA